MWWLPLATAGAGLLSSFIKGKPQEYRETPLQRQMGSFMQNLLRQGGTTMNPQLFSQFAQAYSVPQQAQWAMNILPQIFGGMPQGGQGGQMGQMPGQMGQMPQSVGWGGQGGGGFMTNPFAMPGYARGGIAWNPQIAMLGERGPEAIVPLGQQMGMGQPQYGQMGQPPPPPMQMQPTGIGTPQFGPTGGMPTGQQMGMGQLQYGMGQPMQMQPTGQMNALMNLIGQMGMQGGQTGYSQPMTQNAGFGGQQKRGFSMRPFQMPFRI